MLFAKTVAVADALVAVLKNVKKANGCRYDAVVSEIDEGFDPQQTVEITLEPFGFRAAGEEAIGHTELDLFFQINVLVSRRLATEEISISRVALQVVAEVERELFKDPQLGNRVQYMWIERADRNDRADTGYYEWILLLAANVSYPQHNAIDQE